MRVLVGDIGGTKTHLALAQLGDPRAVQLSDARRYKSAHAPSLGAILRRYAEELGGEAAGPPVDVAALAVAGPVQGNRCKTTNLPWELDAGALAGDLGVAEVMLLNDLEAIAWAVPGLAGAELLRLHEPDPSGEADARIGVGNACVIAAGTGLGVAGLFWDGAHHRPFATEAGHAELSATDEREFALIRHLRQRFGRVSWERAVSGQGIVHLFEFLLAWRGASRPSWLDEREPAAMIAHAAERGSDELCVEAMDLFAGLFARFIGDLALAHMALGGVYLAGGVTLSNLRLLTRSGFLPGVFAKGRMAALLERMPLRVITQPDVALIGAARFAAGRHQP